MVGDFNGSWRLVAVYLNAYADLYGYSALPNAYTTPIDATAITNIVGLTTFCAFNGTNNCTNTNYHQQPDGAPAETFATGGADTMIGFSEQSFYVLGSEPSRTAPLYAAQVPYGTLQQPLLFADAFVANAATCPVGSACDGDVQAFTGTANSPQVLSMITYSWDLNFQSPPRRLLPAAYAFWNQPLVQRDQLYQQFLPIVQRAQAFPNDISAQLKTQIYGGVCAALVAQVPYSC